MSDQATLTGKPSGPPRSAAGGVCHAPADMKCNLDLHEGGRCRSRPCRHCSTGCMYWGRK